MKPCMMSKAKSALSGKSRQRARTLATPVVPAGKRILIFGLGAYEHGSGSAAAWYFARRGYQVTVTDLKAEQQLNAKTIQRLRRLGVQLVLGKHRRADIAAADAIVRNPGVPDNSPFIEYAHRLRKPITNDVAIFLLALRERFADGSVPVVAVTGTRGKSTTTALIGHILKTKFGVGQVHIGGNIGLSPLLFLDKIKPGHVVVLEMSSWLLRDVHEAAFTVAVVTNILRDHMNYYKNMLLYQRDKERIFLGQTVLDYAVLNQYDQRVRGMAKRTVAKVRWFGAKAVADTKLRGQHNHFNVGAAWQVGKIFGLTHAQLRMAVRTFQPLANRLEEVRQFQRRTFINDTTATTPDATIAALLAFPARKIILIAGGNSKRLSLRALRPVIKQRVKYLLLLPGNANHEFPKGVTLHTLPQAVQLAWELSQPGDVVLLSPGVTWLPVMNEFERGRQFVRAVHKLR